MKRRTPLTATYRRRGGNPQEAMWSHVGPMFGTLPNGESFNTIGPYIDVYGTEEGGVYVTAQIDGTTLQQFDTTTGSSANGEYAAHIRARYWYDGEVSLGWEVGRKRQILYHTGKRFDISGVIGSDKTIRAGCFLGTVNKPRLLLKDETGQFSIVDLTWNAQDAVYEIAETYLYGVFGPTQRLGNDSDVRHLYSAFMNTQVIVAVVLKQNHTEVQLCQVNQTALQAGLGTSWATTTETYTVPAANISASLSYHRTNPVPSTLQGSSSPGIDSNAVVSFDVLSKHQDITDHVAISGKRVVAVSSTKTRLALIVEDINTACDKRIDKPVYATSEYYWVMATPIIVGGFPFGWNYNYEMTLGAFDSGKLSESWERSAANTYKRLVFDLDIYRDALGKLSAYYLKWPDEHSFMSGGTFSSVSSYYERFALPMFNIREMNMQIVPPLTDIATAFRGNMYEENKYSYERHWNQSIKFYACDPARDIYLYEKIHGDFARDFVSYTAAGYAHPADEDLAVRNTVAATVKLMLRYRDKDDNYVDVELASKPMTEETGTWAQKRDNSVEPTMPYYTQEQPAMTGNVNWYNVEAKSINLSIDLGFDGRYLATDPDKTGCVFALQSDFDRTETLVDDRYKFLTDGPPFDFANTLKTFFEAYRACNKKSPTTDVLTFDPLAGLDLDIRLFEDRHRLVCNASSTSGNVSVPTYKRPPEWPDIRGYYDFRNRMQFGNWNGMPLMRFVKPKAEEPVVEANPQDNPPITVVTDI